jgi:hypothetical protein
MREPWDDAETSPPYDYPEAYYDLVDGRPVPPVVELPADFREGVGRHLREALRWIEDRETSRDLRSFANQGVRIALATLPDERAVTDVLALLHRAIDRRDLHALALVDSLPSHLLDGREASESALVPLGDHALRAGNLDALVTIATTAVGRRSMSVPVDWIRAIAEAHTGPADARVIDVLEGWLTRPDTSPEAIALVMQRRPALCAGLYEPPAVFDPPIADAASRSARG